MKIHPQAFFVIILIAPLCVAQNIESSVQNVKPDTKVVDPVALLDEIDRQTLVVVYGHLGPRAIERAVGVVSVATRERCVRHHDVRKVPFSKMGGRITALLEKPRQENGLRVEPVGHASLYMALDRGEVPVDAVSCRKVTC